jgi:hypothetical protein
LYASPNIIRVIKLGRMRWAEYVARMKDMRIAYEISIRKFEGKRLFGKHRSGQEDNINVDFKEIICGSGFTWLKRSEW